MSKTILGVNDMIEQGQQLTFVQGKGFTGKRTWIGPKEHAWGLCRILMGDGYDVTKTDDGPNAIVEAVASLPDLGTFPGDAPAEAAEKPIPLWEQQINTIEKTIYEHPSLVAVLSPHNIGKLREQVEAKEFEDFGYDSPEQAEIAEPWYRLINAGVESWPVYQPVIRFTGTVSDRFDKTKYLEFRQRVGQILSSERMAKTRSQGGEEAPGFIIGAVFALPTNLSYEMHAGWLKTEPTFTQTSQHQWQIVTEYQGGVWPKLLYDYID